MFMLSPFSLPVIRVLHSFLKKKIIIDTKMQAQHSQNTPWLQKTIRAFTTGNSRTSIDLDGILELVDLTESERFGVMCSDSTISSGAHLTVRVEKTSIITMLIVQHQTERKERLNHNSHKSFLLGFA